MSLYVNDEASGNCCYSPWTVGRFLFFLLLASAATSVVDRLVGCLDIIAAGSTVSEWSDVLDRFL